MSLRAAALLLLGAAPALARELPAPPGPAIEYEAERVEYVSPASSAGARGASVLELSGQVRLKESTWTIRGEHIRVELDARRARAWDGMEVDDGLSYVSGKEGEFDFETREGRVLRAGAQYEEWRVWAREARLDALRRTHFKKVVFTSCDRPDEHYHFRARSMHVYPKKLLYATHVRFHLGKVPVFYTPFLWKSLRERHLLRARVSPGYDRRNGPFARSTTLYGISPELYGKLFVDYYGAQGPAVGAELQFRESEEARGALYGYRIREKRSGEERWGVLGDHYRSLGSSWAVQGRLQAQADPEFNNHYSRSNAFRVSPELVNGAALLRRTPLSVTRLSYSRLDGQSPLGRGFARERESMPRLDFQTAPLALGRTGWLYVGTLFADNQYERGRGFLQRSAGGGVEGTRTWNLARGVSFTPRWALQESYESRRDAYTSFASSRSYLDAFTGRYELAGNVRFDSLIGDLDTAYSFLRRLKPDSFQDDAGAPDRGLERSLFSVQDTLRPNRRVLVRVGTGYDFRQPRGLSVTPRDRVEPFTADFLLLPTRLWQIAVRDSYKLSEGNRAFLFQADWGERSGTYAGFGLNHSRGHAGDYLTALEGGWGPEKSPWRLGATLRLLLRSPSGPRFNSARLYEKELFVARDLHDFHVRALVRMRPGGIKEVQLRADLLTGRRKEQKIRRRDWEQEWFPWRDERTDD